MDQKSELQQRYPLSSRKFWKKNFRFKFNSSFISVDTSVVSTSNQQLPYSSIQDVTIKQGIVDRFFGICNVVIANASSRSVGITLTGQTLESGNKISSIVKSLILKSDHSKTGL